MTTAYTSLLGLALPVTGELSGTWGDTVNNSITSLLDSAIAGTTTLSSDVDVTLTTTTGASNTSRQAILLWTAGGTVTRNITAPAQSKIYTVINASSSTQSIVLRGVGPTTGVTIVKGESAVCAWNGSDFIKISNTGGAAVFTTLDVTNLEVTNIKALDGTSAASIANSTGVISLTANPILSGGTANGVAYLNGSKVLTTGSALTFDGATLTNNAAGTATALSLNSTNGTYGLDVALKYSGTNIGSIGSSKGIDSTGNLTDLGINSAANLDFATGYTRRMRLDSSGNLGLGVTPSTTTFSGSKMLQLSSVGNVLQGVTSAYYAMVQGAFFNSAGNWQSTGSGYRISQYAQGDGAHNWYTAPVTTAGSTVTYTNAMVLDASGNLGVGTSSPPTGYRAQFVDTRAADSVAIGVRNLSSSGIARCVLGNDTGFARMTMGYTGSTFVNPSIGWIGTEGTEPFYFQTGGTERARFNTTGAFVFAGGTTTANGVGITFPATQSASSNANTLDDYEEGTWTPTDGSGAGLSLTVISASYTKIGRLVYAWCYVNYPVTASTATATIAGFPFVQDPANTYAHGNARSFAVSTLMQVQMNTAASTAVFYTAGNANATNVNFSNNYLVFSIVYQTT